MMRRRMIIDRIDYDDARVAVEKLNHLLRENADQLAETGHLVEGRNAVDDIERLLFGAYDVWEDRQKHLAEVERNGNDGYRGVRAMRHSRRTKERI